MRSGRRRIGSKERAKALQQLQLAFDENRIDYDDYERARQHITAARTRGELKEATAGHEDVTDAVRQAVAALLAAGVLAGVGQSTAALIASFLSLALAVLAGRALLGRRR